MRSKRWAKALVSKLTGNKLDIRAERVKALMKKLDAAAKSNYGSLAKTDNVTEKAQKSTESDESTEGEQTDTGTEKRAENDKKMMVVGEGAETANYSELVKAKAMLKANPNADTVSKTGWWQGKDGKWRYEIADNEMRFERDGLYRNPQTLEDYIEHDELFKAYPHLRNVRVKFERVVGSDPKTNGQYDAVNNVITLKSGRSNEDTKRTLIHEIQHAVQEYEGFSKGFNTNGGYIEWFNQVFDKVKDTREYKSLRTPEERKAYVENMAMFPGEAAIDKTARSLYRNNYGEIEARITAKRLELNDEQRRKTPIVNDGNTYSLEDIHTKFVDNLHSMGYTDNQIQEEFNGDETNGRAKENEQSTRGSTKGKYIATDIEGARSSRNANTRGEGKNQERVYDGRVKYSVSPETDADYLSSVENGDMETAQRTASDSKEDLKWSVSPSLDSDIDSVLNGTFDASRNEVYLGETSQFMTDVIGARSLALYMPAAKVYSSILTRDEYNKKPYYTEQDNYHGIGKEDFIDILERSENPIAAFAAAPDEKGNKRLNRIVLVTDKIIKDTETGEEGYAVVVEEVDTNGLNDGKRVKANKAITVYPRTRLDSDIALAIVDGRLLDLNEKGRHLFAGVRGSNPQAAIRKDVFKKNIANFWANVKWANEKNKIYSSAVTPTTTAMEDAIKNSSYYKSMQNSENDTDRRSSLSEDVDTDNELSYEQLKRQLEKQKQKNKELAGELIRTHGKKLDPKSVIVNLYARFGGLII